MAAPLLTLRDVRFGYDPGTDVLGPIDVSIHAGELWAVVGPNGAGKSTLLRLMAGLLPARSGTVSWAGTPFAKTSRRERARRIAFLPQQTTAAENFTAREWVMLGRFPHRSFGLFEDADDARHSSWAMERAEVQAFADRSVLTLSGGEFQRVRIAAAIAQEPQLLLLDEPTAALDLQHQLSVLRLVRELVSKEGLAAVVVTHDVNLALRFCDRTLLLHQGRRVGEGSSCQILTPEILGPVYGVALLALTDPAQANRPWIVPRCPEVPSAP